MTKIPNSDPGAPQRTPAFSAFWSFKFDDFVKSRFGAVFVIPAEAGIQLNHAVLDSRLRGSDGSYDFLRVHHF
jgi:hypothetical protein